MSGQVPGNAAAVDGEVRRLIHLSEQLGRTADVFDRLEVDGWAGNAREDFDGFRQVAIRRLREASDTHESAARALGRYHATLVHVQDTARHCADEVLVARLKVQLEEEAGTVAASLRELTATLDTIGELLPREPVFVPPPEPRVPAGPSTSESTPSPHEVVEHGVPGHGVMHQGVLVTDEHLHDGDGFDPARRLLGLSALTHLTAETTLVSRAPL